MTMKIIKSRFTGVASNAFEVTEITEVPDDVDPHQFFQQVIDDCPDCQAARARGEVPVIVRPDNESRQVRRARARRLARRHHS